MLARSFPDAGIERDSIDDVKLSGVRVPSLTAAEGHELVLAIDELRGPVTVPRVRRDAIAHVGSRGQVARYNVGMAARLDPGAPHRRVVLESQSADVVAGPGAGAAAAENQHLAACRLQRATAEGENAGTRIAEADVVELRIGQTGRELRRAVHRADRGVRDCGPFVDRQPLHPPRSRRAGGDGPQRTRGRSLFGRCLRVPTAGCRKAERGRARSGERAQLTKEPASSQE